MLPDVLDLTPEQLAELRARNQAQLEADRAFIAAQRADRDKAVLAACDAIVGIEHQLARMLLDTRTDQARRALKALLDYLP